MDRRLIRETPQYRECAGNPVRSGRMLLHVLKLDIIICRATVKLLSLFFCLSGEASRTTVNNGASNKSPGDFRPQGRFGDSLGPPAPAGQQASAARSASRALQNALTPFQPRHASKSNQINKSTATPIQSQGSKTSPACQISPTAPGAFFSHPLR
jgi:hypothetical protein